VAAGVGSVAIVEMVAEIEAAVTVAHEIISPG
jgi:hypothetical protein